ncbi:MAG: tRNA (N6-threonylcarbamoyladenosine(37)-N6)-methyltransferase TrmO [Lachnospiraceae bacterium]|nr:tRNA (N6-threonylcarbamoyladenosine(37)-N6)-methyltransferase TrmO [Lachnospiraceae bacterium]
MDVIAHIYTDFPSKFGIPRQSGVVPELTGRIVFEPAYRNPEALRGLEGFNYIWLLWQFSEAKQKTWSATVKPPRLGGNRKMGVFATRSPFRPNSIGLSSLRLLEIQKDTKEGPILLVGGVDLLNGTPILDIKPYLPYTDCHNDATGGFAAEVQEYHLQVEFPQKLLEQIPPEKQKALIGVLEQDPRPSYQEDPERRYGVEFLNYDVRFNVRDGILTVCEIEKLR